MGSRGWNEVMWVVEFGMKLCGQSVEVGMKLGGQSRLE